MRALPLFLALLLPWVAQAAPPNRTASPCFTVEKVTGEALGKGGQGAVTLGVSATGITVAIKTPGPHGSLAGLRREAEMLARIGPFDRSGLFIRGQFDKKAGALVMEYPSGAVPLFDSIYALPAPSKEAVASLLSQLREAQLTLRAARIVHGNLAPDNLLVTPEGKLKIIDFGSAAEVNTRRRNRYGHYGYVSPSQENGMPASYLDDSYTLRKVAAAMDLHHEGFAQRFAN